MIYTEIPYIGLIINIRYLRNGFVRAKEGIPSFAIVLSTNAGSGRIISAKDILESCIRTLPNIVAGLSCGTLTFGLQK